MAQTPTKTPLQYAPERPRADWVKYALFGAALVLLVVGVLLLRPNNTPAPAPAPPAADRHGARRATASQPPTPRRYSEPG